MKKPELSMEIDTTRSMVTFFNVNVEDGMRLKNFYEKILEERGLVACKWCYTAFEPTSSLPKNFCSEAHEDMYVNEVLAG